MSVESLISQIKTIPALPESVIEIEKLFQDSDPSMTKLMKIVEQDPIVTADILAVANSPMYSFNKQIVSVSQAITLFGMQTIRGIVLSAITNNSFTFDMSPYGIDNKKYKDTASLQSLLMFRWFMSIDINKANMLIPIAFMMDIGKVLIANDILSKNHQNEFLKMIQDDKKSITQVEKLFNDISSAEVTALLFEHWHFNDMFVQTIKGSDNPSAVDEEYREYCQAIDVVKTCINVKDMLNEKSIALAKEKVISYGFDVDKFTRTANRLATQLDKV